MPHNDKLLSKSVSLAKDVTDPRKPHSEPIKQIGMYLKTTRDKGTILNKVKTKDLNLNVWADADFCGMFKVEDPDDPKSVRSQTGFLVTLARRQSSHLAKQDSI